MRGVVTALVRALVTALLVTVVAAGCVQRTEPSGDATVDASGAPIVAATTVPPPEAPDGIEFFADYSRYLWHRRRLVVATTNHTSTPIEVSSIALRTGHFEPLAAESKSTTILPGNRVDLQVDFGPIASCTAPPTGPSRVEIAIADPSGEPITYLAPLDPAPLDEIRARECARREVTDAANIGFSQDRTVEATVMRTTIDLTRVGGSAPVRIDSLKGSVIIGLDSPVTTEPLVVLGDTDDVARLPVELSIVRCEPHAVSQSTLTYELNAFVGVGSAAAIRFPVEVDDDLRAELGAMIERCIAELTG